MSIRDSLKQSINKNQGNVLRVASPRGRNMQQMTPILQQHPQQVMQQHPQEASCINVIDATRDATTMQQTPKKHATNVQQNLGGTQQNLRGSATHKTVAIANPENEKNTEVEIELVRAWLHKINEPSEDHYLIIEKCRKDPEALEYFMKHVNGEFL